MYFVGFVSFGRLWDWHSQKLELSRSNHRNYLIDPESLNSDRSFDGRKGLFAQFGYSAPVLFDSGWSGLECFEALKYFDCFVHSEYFVHPVPAEYYLDSYLEYFGSVDFGCFWNFVENKRSVARCSISQSPVSCQVVVDWSGSEGSSIVVGCSFGAIGSLVVALFGYCFGGKGWAGYSYFLLREERGVGKLWKVLELKNFAIFELFI